MKNRNNNMKFQQKTTVSCRCLLWAALLSAVALTGCAEAGKDAVPVESITLHEPETIAESAAAEPAFRRNLYQASFYECYVTPYVEEYSFDSFQYFGSYLALPGDTVSKGDPLATAEEDDLLEEIKAVKEVLTDLAEEYETYRRKAEEALAVQRGELAYFGEILDNLDGQKPEEILPGANGIPEANPDFAAWQAQYRKWTGDYSLKEFQITQSERELERRQELYSMDYNYYEQKLRKLQTERQERTITSRISGSVVGMSPLAKGTGVSAGEPVIAVGDPEHKILVFDRIAPRLLNRAADFYVFINGKRYEVTQQESDDNLSHTVFEIQDEGNEVSMGDYAVLVIMSDYRESVITVPLYSIHRENSADYVYILENGISSPRKVEKGMDDGIFVEILSGVSEGEMVVVPYTRQAPSASILLEKGSTGVPYSVRGETFLPVKITLDNPIINGTVFLDKLIPKLNQYVKKGDVIARVTVEKDEMDISRREIRLQRDKERLADLVAENSEGNQEIIARMEEDIRNQEEELALRKSDYSTTEICSPIDGYIEYLSSAAQGEILNYDKFIARIADSSQVLIAMPTDSESIASYGSIVEIEYPDKEVQYSGKFNYLTGCCQAVTVPPPGLSPQLSGYILLKPDEETAAQIAVTDEALHYSNEFSKTTIMLNGTIKEMSNVILLPKKAVIAMPEEGGNVGYVWIRIKDDDAVFIPVLLHQSDKESYLVIDGLTEGMEVLCWE